MRHPEILALPVAMLADYYLTVFGEILRQKAFSHHFKIQDYELNPFWKNDISKKRLFNPRFFLIDGVITLIGISIVERESMPDGFVKLFLGFFLGVYGPIIGRHLSNLLIFRYLIKDPQSLSGQVALSNRYLLKASFFQNATMLVTLIPILIVSSEPFIVGAVLGTISLLLAHFFWSKKIGSSPK